MVERQGGDDRDGPLPHEEFEAVEFDAGDRPDAPEVDGSAVVTAGKCQPRAEEVLMHVADEIRESGWERQLSSGVVMTGGGALLDGMVEVAEQVFGVKVTVAPDPRLKPGMAAEVDLGVEANAK